MPTGISMASPGVVGFLGLGDWSLELAASLRRSGYSVQAFCPQMNDTSMNEFLKLGGTRCANASEVGKGVTALVLWTRDTNHADSFIFGQQTLTGLNKDTVIIIHTSISPTYIQKLEQHLADECGGKFVVDTYVTQGKSEALKGKIMVTSSGRPDAISRAHPILSAMCEKLYIFEGEIGAGSKVKMVVEVLEGIHLVASVEAISLGVQAGIHPWIIYDIISNAAGNSWIFKNEVQKWLKGDHMIPDSLESILENLFVRLIILEKRNVYIVSEHAAVLFK